MLYLYKGPYPPSANNAYYNGKGGGRVLTKAAAEWQAMMPAFMQEGDRGAYDNYVGVPWTLTYWLNLPEAEGDISNRVKLLEDALADFLGLNDRHNNELHIKRSDVQPDGTPLLPGWCVAIVMITGVGKPKPKPRVVKGRKKG